MTGTRRRRSSRELYTAFAARCDARVFDQIARADTDRLNPVVAAGEVGGARAFVWRRG